LIRIVSHVDKESVDICYLTHCHICEDDVDEDLPNFIAIKTAKQGEEVKWESEWKDKTLTTFCQRRY
jgi:hypothetical protein